MSLPRTFEPMTLPGSTPGLTHPLLPKLRALKLSGMLQTLETRAAQAAQSQLAPTEFLALLLDDELARRDDGVRVAMEPKTGIRATRGDPPTTFLSGQRDQILPGLL